MNFTTEFSPVVSVVYEKEGTEHTALGCSDVQHYSGGGVTAHLKCLGYFFEQVQYPVAECGTPRVLSFPNSFMRETVLNAELKSTS